MTSDAGLFRILGIMALCYAGYGIMTGSIRLSIWPASRDNSPFSFWFSVAAWAALGLVVFSSLSSGPISNGEVGDLRTCNKRLT